MSQPGSGNRGATGDSQRLRDAALTAVQHFVPGTSDTEYHWVLCGVVVGALPRDPNPQILFMRNVSLGPLEM
jgi:hypothetical protein